MSLKASGLQSSTPQRYVSIREAAEALSMDKATVYRLVASEELPGYRIGRRIVLRLDELDQFMEARRTIPRDPFPADPIAGKL